jgi:hypothetical protein
MKKLTPFFIQDSNRICESWLSGQRHGRNAADVDEMRALLAVDYTLRMSEGARRSRSPQMRIFARPCSQLKLASMPLTVQDKRAKAAQETKQL